MNYLSAYQLNALIVSHVGANYELYFNDPANLFSKKRFYQGESTCKVLVNTKSGFDIPEYEYEFWDLIVDFGGMCLPQYCMVRTVGIYDNPSSKEMLFYLIEKKTISSVQKGIISTIKQIQNNFSGFWKQTLDSVSLVHKGDLFLDELFSEKGYTDYTVIVGQASNESLKINSFWGPNETASIELPIYPKRKANFEFKPNQIATFNVGQISYKMCG